MESRKAGEGYQDRNEQDYQGMSVNKVNRDGNEIDLFELVMVLWHQRLLILGVTFMTLLVALIYSFTATPLYKISAQVQSGITDFKRGAPVRGIKPQTLKSYFTQSAIWQNTLPEKAKKSFPHIRAKTKRGSSVVGLYFFCPEAREGITFLNDLIKKATSNDGGISSKKLELSKKDLELSISDGVQKKKSIENERNILTANILIAEKRLSDLKMQTGIIKKEIHTSKDSRKKLANQIDDIRKRTKNLSDVSKLNDEKNRRDKHSLLTYSTLVQQYLLYLTNIERQVSDLRIYINNYTMRELYQKKGEIDRLRKDIERMKRVRDGNLLRQGLSAEKNIQLLRYQLSLLKPLEIVVPPFSSTGPVQPRKALICILAAALGVFIGILGAFLREFGVKNRDTFGVVPEDEEAIKGTDEQSKP